MSKGVRKALMIAKGPVSSGYLPPGNPQRTANLARHMEGSAAPPVLYHGTSKDADFKKFNVPRNGAWLTTSADDASSYAEQNDSQGYKSDWGRNITPTNTASRVVPVHLSAKNPKVYEDPKEFNNLIYSLAKENYKRAFYLISCVKLVMTAFVSEAILGLPCQTRLKSNPLSATTVSTI